MTEQLVKKVLATMQRYGMIARGDHLVVGVSGGADSMCLLQVLYALRDHWALRLTVAHLDHLLRGEQSHRDAEFVHARAEQLGLPCIIEQRDVRMYQTRHGMSLQEAAREVRYSFLMDVLRRCNAQRIALGHHADDQAETLLMRLLRGAGLTGLTGIPPVRDRIIRPLLEVRRAEIEQFLAQHGIAFLADTSVYEQYYMRNKIRHQLLPLLQRQYNPQIVTALARTAQTLRQDEQLLEKRAADAVAEARLPDADGLVYDLAVLQASEPSLRPRIVRQMIRAAKGDTRRITFRHIDALCRLMDGHGRSQTVQLPGGIWCRREYDRLSFTRKPSTATCSYEYCFASLPERVALREIGKTIFFEIVENTGEVPQHEADSGASVVIDYAAAQMPLTVRAWLPGDRFVPLGMQGTKKLQDFFTDRKVPRSIRQSIPIVLFNNRIAWVAGHQIDDRFKISAATTMLLAMRIA